MPQCDWVAHPGQPLQGFVDGAGHQQLPPPTSPQAHADYFAKLLPSATSVPNYTWTQCSVDPWHKPEAWLSQLKAAGLGPAPTMAAHNRDLVATVTAIVLANPSLHPQPIPDAPLVLLVQNTQGQWDVPSGAMRGPVGSKGPSADGTVEAAALRLLVDQAQMLPTELSILRHCHAPTPLAYQPALADRRGGGAPRPRYMVVFRVHPHVAPLPWIAEPTMDFTDLCAPWKCAKLWIPLFSLAYAGPQPILQKGARVQGGPTGIGRWITRSRVRMVEETIAALFHNDPQPVDLDKDPVGLYERPLSWTRASEWPEMPSLPPTAVLLYRVFTAFLRSVRPPSGGPPTWYLPGLWPPPTIGRIPALPSPQIPGPFPLWLDKQGHPAETQQQTYAEGEHQLCGAATTPWSETSRTPTTLLDPGQVPLAPRTTLSRSRSHTIPQAGRKVPPTRQRSRSPRRHQQPEQGASMAPREEGMEREQAFQLPMGQLWPSVPPPTLRDLARRLEKRASQANAALLSGELSRLALEGEARAPADRPLGDRSRLHLQWTHPQVQAAGLPTPSLVHALATLHCREPTQGAPPMALPMLFPLPAPTPLTPLPVPHLPGWRPVLPSRPGSLQQGVASLQVEWTRQTALDGCCPICKAPIPGLAFQDDLMSETMHFCTYHVVEAVLALIHRYPALGFGEVEANTWVSLLSSHVPSTLPHSAPPTRSAEQVPALLQDPSPVSPASTSSFTSSEGWDSTDTDE